MFYQSSILAILALSTISTFGSPIPAPTPMETGGLKQATRDEIIPRHNKPKRALPSPAPPPREVRSGEPVYSLYFQGSGVIENDTNPGKKHASTITIPGATTQNSAIKRCADHAAQTEDGYFSFQLYYDTPSSIEEGSWICTAYYEVNTDTSYFNIQRPTAGPVFGYSVNTDGSAIP
ncbi:hypothetical protein L486_05472 [Kwoniella mangroviensis CBS 10435]|uniref:Ubiquitin 3 binding protein But2 C-terminal domain-containing protein n=1 Tax=Kwoniella mangroviensis CBS 10435 TaxID=1331196 RepID=A0A1B9ILY0_9TREE|nr:uncharacterized protein I203_05603 [Kwoniella mangroviensis CBS 8507]OCF56619.1 hypothetical protein L486_05472 [Kwoniella mangroviensis CBS 10435]OCF65354.1 hypothetical protein I203_05603 [Kwoniella mangroviensis CBS 8507]